MAETNQTIIDKLVPIFTEIDTLADDAKEILSGAKEAGLDSAMLSKVAKAKANSKLGDLEKKTGKLLDLIESL